MTAVSKCNGSIGSLHPSYIIYIFLLIGLNIASSGTNGEKIMACYFQDGKPFNFSGDAIDPFLCTHIICAGGIMTPDGVETRHPEDMAQYKAVASLRGKNSRLKVMVSFEQGFQSVVDTSSTFIFERFAMRAITFLEKLNMNGLDLDWEFPEEAEKQKYMRFIQILSTYLHASNLLLSMALPAIPDHFDPGFDLDTINKYVDFVTVMTYDYHGFHKNDNITGYNSPLYTPAGEYLFMSTADSLTYLLAKGLYRNKTLMGVPTYGRSWTLANPQIHGLHSPAVALGPPAPYSHITGVYVYPDVCIAIAQGASYVEDQMNVGQYIYNGTTWVAYEGPYTIGKKMEWVKERDLAGVGIWAYQLDDLHNHCHYALGPMSLLQQMRKALQGSSSLYFYPEH